MKNHQVTIRLETEAGELVSYGSVPKFLKLPRVAFWGERVFVRAGSTFVLGQWKIVPRYREAFAVAVVDANMPRDRISGGAIMVLPTEARRAAGDGLYYLGNRGFGA